MNASGQAKEALIAEILGEVDALLCRVEDLVPRLDTATAQIAQSTKAAVDHIDRQGDAVQAVMAHAQTSAVDHIVRKTNSVAKATLDEQTAALTAAARLLFDKEVLAAVLALRAELRAAPSMRLFLLLGSSALFSSALTAAALVLLRL